MLLNNFAKFINFDFNTYDLHFLTESTYFEWLDRLANESLRVKEEIIFLIYQSSDDIFIHKTIQANQSLLVSLIEKLGGELGYEKREIHNHLPSLLIVKEFAINCLDDVLKLLEKDFEKYLNLDVPVPPRIKNQLKKELQNVEKQVNFKDEAWHLIQLIVDIIKKHIAPERMLTYRESKYYEKLISEIGLIWINHGLDHLSSLMSGLIYLNFNSYRYFNYCTNQYRTKLNSIENMTDELQQLYQFRKNIAQQKIGNGYSYKPADISLKEQLFNWLNEEIIYLEKKINSTILNPVEKESFKFLSNLTVAQIGLFIRLFIDIGYLNNKNITEMLKFVSRFTSTPQAKIMSAESLRIKYYNIESSTKEALKGILLKMISHLKENSNL